MATEAGRRWEAPILGNGVETRDEGGKSNLLFVPRFWLEATPEGGMVAGFVPGSGTQPEGTTEAQLREAERALRRGTAQTGISFARHSRMSRGADGDPPSQTILYSRDRILATPNSDQLHPEGLKAICAAVGEVGLALESEDGIWTPDPALTAASGHADIYVVPNPDNVMTLMGDHVTTGDLALAGLRLASLPNLIPLAA